MLVTPIRHPSYLDAATIIEVLATAREPRPRRALLLLHHVRLAVWVQVDLPAGSISPSVSGDVDVFFECLTLLC